MTDLERRVLDAYARMSVNDVAPTLDEVGRAVGAPHASVHRAQQSLIQQGFMAHIPGKKRNVRILRTTAIDLGVNALVSQYGAAAVLAEVARQTGVQAA